MLGASKLRPPAAPAAEPALAEPSAAGGRISGPPSPVLCSGPRRSENNLFSTILARLICCFYRCSLTATHHQLGTELPLRWFFNGVFTLGFESRLSEHSHQKENICRGVESLAGNAAFRLWQSLLVNGAVLQLQRTAPCFSTSCQGLAIVISGNAWRELLKSPTKLIKRVTF